MLIPIISASLRQEKCSHRSRSLFPACTWARSLLPGHRGAPNISLFCHSPADLPYAGQRRASHMGLLMGPLQLYLSKYWIMLRGPISDYYRMWAKYSASANFLGSRGANKHLPLQERRIAASCIWLASSTVVDTYLVMSRGQRAK